MNESGRLAGRVALVTGAGAGSDSPWPSASCARARASRSPSSTASWRARPRRRSARPGIGVQCDVAKADDVERAFDACLERFGRLDILVNNAAVTGPRCRHFLEIDEPLWDLVVDANLKGHFLCAHRAARHMVEQGAGVIINTSSGGAQPRAPRHGRLRRGQGRRGGVHARRRARSRALRRALRVHRPGPHGDERDTGAEAEERARATALTVPLGRQGTGADIAGAAVFLAGDDAGYLTGSCIYVDGGVLVQQRSPQVETFPLERYPRVGRLA